MRLKSFEVRGRGPIKLVQVPDLSDVVVLAGPNGVGKTNINNAILEHARQTAPSPNVHFQMQATSEAERSAWNKALLDTRDPQDAELLRKTLQKNQRRNKYTSSFLNFDSDRAIRNVHEFGFSWDIINPLMEEVGWDLGFANLSNRYNDVRHSLFRLVESQRREIADLALRLRDTGKGEMNLDFPDVLKPFKDAFWQLLAPKKLVEVNVKQQQIFYEYGGKTLNFDTLSSGEREVVNVVFDFILRGPSHSIIIFDEPELHLHPELSYKLLQTLSRIGESNQFIFSSHSPEIISASLENTVVFITPAREEERNQAIMVHRDDETHHALQTLGQSIGIISLGKKLILIEGEEASLDKQTYGAILKNNFPEFVLVPVGGKDVLRSFDEIKRSILDKTLWGVEFFLICDRDALTSLGGEAAGRTVTTRMRSLPRYHLENYFLDERVWAAVFKIVEQPGSWLCDETKIREKLLEIARSAVPYAVALNVNATIRKTVGNISIMPKGASDAKSADDLVALMTARLASETRRISGGLYPERVEELIRDEFDRLTGAVDNDLPAWRSDLPGRFILNKFAASANFQVGRLKQMYLRSSETYQPFGDIFEIFEAFRHVGGVRTFGH